MPPDEHPSHPVAPPPPPALTIELPPHPPQDPNDQSVPHKDTWSLAVPAAPALLSLDGPDDRPLQLLVAADARAAARKRLLPDHQPDHPSARADLRPITARIRIWPIGSQLEGDLLFHHIASAEKPELARAALDRAAAWFLHIDPEEPFPKWRKVSTNELAADPSAPIATAGTLLGPIRDKHACNRAIDELNDLFDLCRYHHTLVLAPNAQACAYKELGKCPAPCDGSEPMPDYRARLREAIDFWYHPEPWHTTTERAMNDASQALDFERAARVKERLITAQHLNTSPFAHARRDWRRGWLILTSAAAPNTIRLTHATPHTLHHLADIPTTESGDGAWRSILAAAPGIQQPPPNASLPPIAWQRLGILAQRLYSSPPRLPHPEPDADPPESPPATGKRWAFAAFVSGNPWQVVNRFTSSDQTGTVPLPPSVPPSVPPVGPPPDPADQPDPAFTSAWRKATRAIAKPKRTPKPPADHQGPAE